MIVSFTIEIEVNEPEDQSEIAEANEAMNILLSKFEEVVAQDNWDLHDSHWETC